MPTNRADKAVVKFNPPKYVPHLHTIILLHDKGSNGSEFCDQLFSAKTRPRRGLPRTLNKAYDCCRWIFPTALDLDEDGARQWFNTPDMWNPQNSSGQHPALEQSIEQVLAIVEEEAGYIGLEHIFIGGFGQGFAVAAGAFLVEGTGDFAGLIGLNGWFPFSELLLEEMDGLHPSAWVNRARILLAPTKFPDASNVPHSCGIIRKNAIPGSKKTPIFLAHPGYDLVVDPSETSLTCQVFEAMGWAGLDWEDYGSEDEHGQPNHGINAPKGIDDLCLWLINHFANCSRHPRNGHILSFIHSQNPDGV